MAKPKIAFYWCASCGGCEEAIVDLAEQILPVVEAVDIVFWPCAMDFKTRDIEQMANGSIAVAFINGAVRTSEQEHMAKLMRQKSGLVVAFGSCAGLGGIPALANLTSRKKIFEASYHDCPSVFNPDGVEPKTEVVVDGHKLTLPTFYETVYKLDDVITVDYYLPGCPPTTDIIVNAINAILEGKLPPKGAVLSPDKSLCSSCKLNDTKPDQVCIGPIKRIIDIIADPEKCFLTQGLICMGPATRDGCGALCIQGNMPCTGCFGPTDSCRDQGGKMISSLGGILEGEDRDSLQKATKGLVDPSGTFYRYSMSASLLGSARKEGE
ncbi:MAG: oxidoreductase [Desulfobacterium sp.]|nr:oxidoreductase [Desulfobacterium sp.]